MTHQYGIQWKLEWLYSLANMYVLPKTKKLVVSLSADKGYSQKCVLISRLATQISIRMSPNKDKQLSMTQPSFEWLRGDFSSPSSELQFCPLAHCAPQETLVGRGNIQSSVMMILYIRIFNMHDRLFILAALMIT